jgi:hypothetical protein
VVDPEWDHIREQDGIFFLNMISACRECKGKVSTEAASCPHCGAPDPTSGWKSIDEAPPRPSAAIQDEATDRIPKLPAPIEAKPAVSPQIVFMTPPSPRPQKARIIKVVRRVGGGGFQTGFGLGCGVLSALIAVPIIAVGVLVAWILGWLSFASQKEGVKIKVAEPLTTKITDEWSKAQAQEVARKKRVEGLELFGFEESRLPNAVIYSGGEQWKQLHAREDCPVYSATAKEHAGRLFIVRNGRYVDAQGFYHDERSLCERCIP